MVGLRRGEPIVTLVPIKRKPFDGTYLPRGTIGILTNFSQRYLTISIRGRMYHFALNKEEITWRRTNAVRRANPGLIGELVASFTK